MSSHLAFLLPRANSNAPADEIGLLFIAAGPVLYFLARAFRPQRINP